MRDMIYIYIVGGKTYVSFSDSSQPATRKEYRPTAASINRLKSALSNKVAREDWYPGTVHYSVGYACLPYYKKIEEV